MQQLILGIKDLSTFKLNTLNSTFKLISFYGPQRLCTFLFQSGLNFANFMCQLVEISNLMELPVIKLGPSNSQKIEATLKYAIYDLNYLLKYIHAIIVLGYICFFCRQSYICCFKTYVGLNSLLST